MKYIHKSYRDCFSFFDMGGNLRIKMGKIKEKRHRENSPLEKGLGGCDRLKIFNPFKVN